MRTLSQSDLPLSIRDGYDEFAAAGRYRGIGRLRAARNRSYAAAVASVFSPER